ncbi:MAG: ABC transporter permease subunit, partial [Paracoccaceae bacterium]
MIPGPTQDKDFPWWLLVAGGIAAYLMYRVVSDDLYAQVLGTLSKGIGVTIFVTLVGFSIASAVGLLLAVGSLSRFLVIRQISRFYIEIVRGIPIIVLLLYVAFVLAPFMVASWNWAITSLGFDPIRNRDFSL